MDTPLTFGIEEEFFLIDADSGSLVPAVERVLVCLPLNTLNYGTDMFQCQLELRTQPCFSIADAIQEVATLRSTLLRCLPSGVALINGAIHPFSKADGQPIVPTPHNQSVLQELQQTVRHLVTCGLHLNVGFADRELAMCCSPIIAQYLPLFLSLSANSPFFQGSTTGLASYRAALFSQVPRSGIPPTFGSLAAQERFYQLGDETGSKFPPRQWWDLRYSEKMATLELRICDSTGDLKLVRYLASLFVNVVTYAVQCLRDASPQTVLPHCFIQENRWRAARFGVNAMFIADPAASVQSVEAALSDLLQTFYAIVLKNDALDYLARDMHQVLSANGACQQLQRFHQTEDYMAILKYQQNLISTSLDNHGA